MFLHLDSVDHEDPESPVPSEAPLSILRSGTDEKVNKIFCSVFYKYTIKLDFDLTHSLFNIYLKIL